MQITPQNELYYGIGEKTRIDEIKKWSSHLCKKFTQSSLVDTWKIQVASIRDAGAMECNALPTEVWSHLLGSRFRFMGLNSIKAT